MLFLKKTFAGLFVCLVLIDFTGFAQNTTRKTPASSVLARPKLVVGIVVDQMRYDYLYRFYDKYGEGGLKRLMNEGFNCRNNHYPYALTVTAAGHSAIYTGSVPAINGIVGNDWFDPFAGKIVYCAEDSTVATVGSTNVRRPDVAAQSAGEYHHRPTANRHQLSLENHWHRHQRPGGNSAGWARRHGSLLVRCENRQLDHQYLSIPMNFPNGPRT